MPALDTVQFPTTPLGAMCPPTPPGPLQRCPDSQTSPLGTRPRPPRNTPVSPDSPIRLCPRPLSSPQERMGTNVLASSLGKTPTQPRSRSASPQGVQRPLSLADPFTTPPHGRYEDIPEVPNAPQRRPMRGLEECEVPETSRLPPSALQTQSFTTPPHGRYDDIPEIPSAPRRRPMRGLEQGFQRLNIDSSPYIVRQDPIPQIYSPDGSAAARQIRDNFYRELNRSFGRMVPVRQPMTQPDAAPSYKISDLDRPGVLPSVPVSPPPNYDRPNRGATTSGVPFSPPPGYLPRGAVDPAQLHRERTRSRRRPLATLHGPPAPANSPVSSPEGAGARPQGATSSCTPERVERRELAQPNFQLVFPSQRYPSSSPPSYHSNDPLGSNPSTPSSMSPARLIDTAAPCPISNAPYPRSRSAGPSSSSRSPTFSAQPPATQLSPFEENASQEGLQWQQVECFEPQRDLTRSRSRTC